MRLSRPNPAAAKPPNSIRCTATEGSGDLTRPASTAARKVRLAAGNSVLTTAASLAWLMPEPLIKIMLAAGPPSAPGRVCSGMMTNMPPPGQAGVRVTMPVTWTRTGPSCGEEVSSLTCAPSAAAADGEASTSMTAPGAVAARATRGNGVSAVNAAYPAGSTAVTASCWPELVFQVVFQTAATCRTPGTAAIDFCTAGVTGLTAASVVMTASAPVACQELATSPLAMAPLTMPAKVATVRARASVNRGPVVARLLRAELARAI